MKFSRAVVISLLAVLGFGVSIYLLTVHLGWWNAVCLGVGNCELVNTSRFSEFLGLPVAVWGMGAYVALAALAVALWRGWLTDWVPRLLFLGAAGGVAFSVYLTYIEVFVLHEICPWCVLSAIIVSVIAILSVLELRNENTNETETI